MGELSITVGQASSAGYWPEEDIPDLIDHELTGCHANVRVQGCLGRIKPNITSCKLM